LLPSSAAACVTANAAPRERLSLDRGWLFHLGDIVQPPIIGHENPTATPKPNAAGAAGTKYDDSDWRRLDLPHDWAVEGPFDPKANVGAGLSSARHRLVPATWRRSRPIAASILNCSSMPRHPRHRVGER
jgi:hypothetical protein